MLFDFEVLTFSSFYFNFFYFLVFYLKDLIFSQLSFVGQKFLAIFLVFLFFIFFSNFFGLFPFVFCLTTQLSVTFSLSFSLFFGVTFFGFFFHGFDFFLLFVPKSVPTILLPFLILIEIISYISRLFSLSVRLFANMVAGHALLHVLLAAYTFPFPYIMDLTAVFLFYSPTSTISGIIGLEICIAFLQTYVFIVLFIIYFNDSFSGGH